MVDIAGIIRQASTPVKVRELLRNGKHDIQLLSRAKIDALVARAIRNLLEASRAGGAPSRGVEGEEAKGEVDGLRTQQERTLKARDELAQSKLQLDRELQDMRDDLAQQRALADGRLPEGVERGMAETRFEKLHGHLEAMDRALKTLFSSRLFSYRQIQAFLRQIASARRAAAADAKRAAFHVVPAPPAAPAATRPVVREPSSGAVPSGGRRIEPFAAMDLELGRGLDLGTVNVRAAARRRGSGETVYNLQRNAFLDVRDDAFARKLLKYGIDYVVRGARGYVIGDPAFEFANIFEKSVRRPMREGVMSPAEPDALLVLGHLVGAVLGPPRQAGEICAFSVPGDPVDDDRNFIYHRSALENVLRGLGYLPRPMLESHLIVFAELKEQDYTGIGISCGGGMVNVCAAYKGVPALAFSTFRGGDWIDAGIAAAVGLPAPIVASLKEAGAGLRGPKGRMQEAMEIYHRQFIRYTLEKMKRKMEGAQSLPEFAMPVHLVLAGGTAMIPGFLDVFREEFEQIEFPLEVEEIRLAADPLKAVAAGCLQAALAETRALEEGMSGAAPAALERAAVSGIPRADPRAAVHLARLLKGASAGGEGWVCPALDRPAAPERYQSG